MNKKNSVAFQEQNIFQFLLHSVVGVSNTHATSVGGMEGMKSRVVTVFICRDNPPHPSPLPESLEDCPKTHFWKFV